jgi:two-component system, OmpR family, sensor histidine kinase BaeS
MESVTVLKPRASEVRVKINIPRFFVPKSLMLKLTVILTAIALTSVVVVAVLANYTINNRFNEYLAEGPGYTMMNPDGTSSNITSSGQAPNFSWMLRHMFGAPEQQFLDAVNQSLWVASVLVVLIAGLMSLVFARRMTSPIQHMTRAAKQISAGQLDERIPVETRDEIGELAASFNQMAESLEKNRQMNQQLLAGIAHELKTPLTIIQGNLEAILDGVQEATPEKIAALHTETALLNRLVNDLRDLTLAEAGQLRLSVEPLKLRPLIAKIVEMLQPMLHDKSINLIVKVPASLPVVTADPDRVTQVFYNLLSNAIRHTPDHGQIDINAATSKDKKFAEITVRDNGDGIPAEDLPLIFNHFYRVDEARARTTGGTGVGLAITKLLVEAQGGAITATSTPGEGSAFTFTLPAVK